MFNKNQLKNMFLLTLERYSAPNSGVYHGADTIIPSLDSGNLSEEEKNLAWEGFQELKREGIIMDDPRQRSTMFSAFTTEGKEYLEELKKIGNEYSRPKLFLKDNVFDRRLLDSCKSAFDDGDYWNAVSHAQRHLEVRVREKSGLDKTGETLMADAFKKEGGKLNILASMDDNEKDGFKFIMMGMMKFHRNQKAHNEGELTIDTAYQIIGYIDYLLKIINNSIKNP